MAPEIRQAVAKDRASIRAIHAALNRPQRLIRIDEYLVAVANGEVLGCAAVRPFRGGGYLYGLAIRRDWQGRGVGSALTRARIERIRSADGQLAVVMAMFWNVAFFRKLGFISVRRADLPSPVRRLADFRDPIYRRSAVLLQRL